MAQKNRANMLTDIVSNIYNNLINFITGQNAQDRLVNLLDSSPNILSDASQPNGYVSTDANNEMFSSYYDEEISRADLITDLTANLAVGGKFYRINDAVGATITLLVIAESNINLYQFAIDATTGEIGTYDITTDVFLTVSGTPDLQQVTDVGFATTNKLLSDDAAGNYTEIGNGEIKIGTGNTGEVIIDASLVTAAYNAQLPDKPTSPQTFAMLSDVTAPNLQQVLDEGNTSTTPIKFDDGAGNSFEIRPDVIKIVNPLGGNAQISSQSLTALTAFNLPNKPAGAQTFAMLSDVSSLVTSVSAGTNISVTGTSTAPIINSLSDRYKTTSVTSNTITNGAKTFTVDANLAYIPLQEVLIVHNPSNHMHATVTSYSGTTLVVDVKTNTGSGTYISWVINLDGVPIDAITGVGTANEIAYFTGGQVIASLPVATYPSLTELSYVKGVSSAIQTQLNAKGTIFSTTTDGAVTVSSTSNVYTSGILIPANSFAVGNNVEVTVRGRKTGTAGNMTMRIYVNTTNDISGTPILVATNTTSAANQTYIQFQRFLSIKSGSTEVFSNTGGSSIDSLPSNLGINGLSIDWTNNLYIVVSTQCVVATDSANARSSFIKIKN